MGQKGPLRQSNPQLISALSQQPASPGSKVHEEAILDANPVELSDVSEHSCSEDRPQARTAQLTPGTTEIVINWFKSLSVGGLLYSNRELDNVDDSEGRILSCYFGHHAKKMRFQSYFHCNSCKIIWHITFFSFIE